MLWKQGRGAFFCCKPTARMQTTSRSPQASLDTCRCETYQSAAAARPSYMCLAVEAFHARGARLCLSVQTLYLLTADCFKRALDHLMTSCRHLRSPSSHRLLHTRATHRTLQQRRSLNVRAEDLPPPPVPKLPKVSVEHSKLEATAYLQLWR